MPIGQGQRLFRSKKWGGTGCSSLPYSYSLHKILVATCAVVMASVMMYVQHIDGWTITCFITFDDLSGHSYSPKFLMFLLFIRVVCA